MGVLLIKLILFIIVVVVAIYVLTYVVTAAAAIAVVGGLAWGGGLAILNYGKSLKENLIDSNRPRADR